MSFLSSEVTPWEFMLMRGATGDETSDPKVETTFGTHPMLLLYAGASLEAENRDPLFRAMR
jgi:hypothetical protein